MSPKLEKSPKMVNFSHNLGIKAISPMRGIKFIIGTYTIECPNDKIIIHRASGAGYGVINGLQIYKESLKITQNGLFFT